MTSFPVCGEMCDSTGKKKSSVQGLINSSSTKKELRLKKSEVGLAK